MGFKILTFILGKLKWSGERHQKKKKKSLIVLLRNTGTLKQNKCMTPTCYPLSLFGKEIAVRALTLVLLGVCEIKQKKIK